MPANDSDAKLRWEQGVPVSGRYEDPYYSRVDGLAEARHVFLEGNRLADRFRGKQAFHIAELGFGTGLNFLAALLLWRSHAAKDAVLTYTSFERFPLEKEAIEKALGQWSELNPTREALIGCLSGTCELPDADLNIVVGDARESIGTMEELADAWFLDGFAPSRNPEMWEPRLMEHVFQRTRQGGTFATYSAAGHVRRALESAGFEVARQPGFGTKREMLAGSKPGIAA